MISETEFINPKMSLIYNLSTQNQLPAKLCITVTNEFDPFSSSNLSGHEALQQIVKSRIPNIPKTFLNQVVLEDAVLFYSVFSKILQKKKKLALSYLGNPGPETERCFRIVSIQTL